MADEHPIPATDESAQSASDSGAEAGDGDPLRRHARERSQDAFAILVECHIAAVRATCREHLGPGHGWLDDATQAVFLILARRGAEIPDALALPAWLRTTARGVCANIRRGERRRREREQDAAIPDEAPALGLQALEQADMRAQLEAAIATVSEAQREAVVRHFLQNKRGRGRGGAGGERGRDQEAHRRRMVVLRAAFQGRVIALPSVLALGLGEDGISPRLLENCIAAGHGGGSLRAHAQAAARPAHGVVATLALPAALGVALALGAFVLRSTQAGTVALPIAVSTSTSTAASASEDPAAVVILGPIRALRENDLHALLDCLPSAERSRIAGAWDGFAATPSPLSAALADAGLAFVRGTSGSDVLLPFNHPLTDDLLLDLRQMSARTRARGLQREGALLADLARDLHGYLTTLDVRDQAVERAVIDASLATGRRWGFRTGAEARTLPFDEVVERLGGVLASVKRWWLPYGLDVDRVLGSVVVDSIHGHGQERTAHIHFVAFSHTYALALGVRRTAGVWECPELEFVMDQALTDISHYIYLPPSLFAPQPAAPTRGDPEDPVPLVRPADLSGAARGPLRCAPRSGMRPSDGPCPALAGSACVHLRDSARPDLRVCGSG